MKKILYVSDLDGTLLDGSQRISEDSRKIIGEFISSGGLFTYATARSLVSASVITKDLGISIPVITNNGVRTMDPQSGEIVFCENFEKAQFDFVLSFLKERNVFPIVYSNAYGKDRFSYVWNLISDEMKAFLAPKQDDPRNAPVEREEELLAGVPYYFVCIGDDQTIWSIYEELVKLESICNCVTYIDVYSGHRWIEIMPRTASKANAALKLKEYLGADELVVFGDGGNDISMFEVADRCYAVSNADKRLITKATGIIGSNEESGVALWLRDNGFIYT